MKIAIEGCAHGELEKIYETIKLLEKKESLQVDLLICCGDFQSSRNEDDLNSMAVPPKYRDICTFYKYYSGEKTAPILTIFIGGNHEASNYLQELPYGGWVAPNIYYMGYAGVINIAGIRIGGLSGIYKGNDYLKGHYEKAPYDQNSIRSVYHIRNLEVFRLMQLSGKIDIFLSHDWPTNITNHGNVQKLLKRKPFFKEDIEKEVLGSKPCEQLIQHLKPGYWFSAHLHCKFAALLKHKDGEKTKFLALDKCLPNREFLQIVDLPHVEEKEIKISYDLEWLTILYLTNHLLCVKNMITYMPGPGATERYNFTPTKEEQHQVLQKFDDDLTVPENFVRTAPAYEKGTKKSSQKPTAIQNPQTVRFCDTLAIDDPVQLISEQTGIPLSLSMEESFNNTTFLEDSVESEQVTSSKKLGNFSLPQPKGTSETLDSEVSVNGENSCEDGESHNVQEISNESQNNTEPGSQASENSENNTIFVEDKTGTPTPKKLKRRNENLYKS